MKFLFSAIVFTTFVSLAGAGVVMGRLVSVPDEWDLRCSWRTLADVAARNESLDRQCALSRRRAAEKERVIGQLYAGRLTLAKAAAHFERIDAEWQQRVGSGFSSYSPLEGREASWANVISRARRVIADTPGRDASVLYRLEAKYRESFGDLPAW